MEKIIFPSSLNESGYDINTLTTLWIEPTNNSHPTIFSDLIGNDDLDNCGRDWKSYHLAKDLNGIARFFYTKRNPRGAFFTSLWSLKNPKTDPRKFLELEKVYGPEISFDYKMRFKILKGCCIFVGKMKFRDIIQIYVSRNLIDKYVKEDGSIENVT